MAVPWLSPGPVVGSGGYLGAVGRTVLQSHLATAGAYLVASSVLLCGLLLCSDYLVLRASAVVLGVPARVLGRSLVKAHRALATAERPKTAKTDLEDAEVRDLAVRIRGKTIDKGVAEVKVAEEEEAETSAEPADEATEDDACQRTKPPRAKTIRHCASNRRDEATGKR